MIGTKKEIVVWQWGTETITLFHWLHNYETATTFVSLFAVVGNSLVIYVISTSPELEHPMTYFICSLALSDLVQGITFPIYTFSHHYEIIVTAVGELTH